MTRPSSRNDAYVVQRRPRIHSGGPTDQWRTLSERDFTRDPKASEDVMAPRSHDACADWITKNAQAAYPVSEYRVALAV